MIIVVIENLYEDNNIIKITKYMNSLNKIKTFKDG